MGYEFSLASDGVRPEAPALPTECGVIFAHGYLGSRFDMLHLCESLARQGFLVAAPDFASALGGQLADASREEVMDALVARLRREFQVQRLGLVGHSAGAAVAAGYAPEGAKVFGRVAIAGLAPVADGAAMVVASTGDGVVRWQRLQGQVEALGMAPEGPESLDASQRRPALLFTKPLKGFRRPPCHISFLAEQTNEAMISLLSPLLPVAQILKAYASQTTFGVGNQLQKQCKTMENHTLHASIGLSTRRRPLDQVPVLDFDTYLQLRDSKEVARVLLPKIEEFLLTRADEKTPPAWLFWPCLVDFMLFPSVSRPQTTSYGYFYGPGTLLDAFGCFQGYSIMLFKIILYDVLGLALLFWPECRPR